MEYIFTFFSHFGAVRFNRKCNEMHIKSRLMPTPRKLSSSCGTCCSIICDIDKSVIVDKYKSLLPHELLEEIEQVAFAGEDGYEIL